MEDKKEVVRLLSQYFSFEHLFSAVEGSIMFCVPIVCALPRISFVYTFRMH